jgi:hypothetical protein
MKIKKKNSKNDSKNDNISSKNDQKINQKMIKISLSQNGQIYTLLFFINLPFCRLFCL